MLNLEGKLQNSVLLRKYTRTDKESADRQRLALFCENVQS